MYGQNQAKRDQRGGSGQGVRSLTWELLGALGGTRTPNLLIRSYGRTVQTCPGVAVLWGDVPGPSSCIGSWLWSWQQSGPAQWLTPGHNPTEARRRVWCRDTRVMIRVPGSAVRVPLALVMRAGYKEGS